MTAAAYEAAIARRNLTLARWQNMRAAWIAHGSPTGDLLADVNEAQRVYEWAVRELVRARVIWRESLEAAA